MWHYNSFLKMCLFLPYYWRPKEDRKERAPLLMLLFPLLHPSFWLNPALFPLPRPPTHQPCTSPWLTQSLSEDSRIICCRNEPQRYWSNDRYEGLRADPAVPPTHCAFLHIYCCFCHRCLEFTFFLLTSCLESFLVSSQDLFQHRAWGT